MSFLSPLAALIAAGITIPLLVSLYFLKLRRRPMAVPSTLLWKKAIQDLQVNAPFQRIRNNLLLWLQLLLLALLLIAMARPTRQAFETTGERVVIVLDRSGSMNTQDGANNQSRLDAAKEAALALVDSLDDSSAGAMVLAFAERAEVVQGFTNDRGLLRAAIRSVQPSDQRSRIEPVLGLIQPHTSPAPGSQGNGAGDNAEGLDVYVFSDGKVHQDTTETPALPGATLRYVPMGAKDTENIGIVAASARRSFDQPGEVAVFARLFNAGPVERRVNVTLMVDGRATRTQALLMPAGGDASVVFDLAGIPGAAALEVMHDHADALSIDDRVRMTLLPARRLRVLLVSPASGGGSRYLREAIVAAGARQLEVRTPEQYEAISPAALRDGDATLGEGFDVIVFDGYAPRTVPPVSSLSFGAAPPIAGLSVKPSAEDAPTMQAVLTWRRDHPVMRYVVLDDVTLRKPGRLSVPMNAQVLAIGLAGPLIAQVEPSGAGALPGALPGAGAGAGRHVVVSFDLLESRWPHHWSFQVFMVNVLEVLGQNARSTSSGVSGVSGGGGGEVTWSFRTGETATVEVPGDVGEASLVSYSGSGGNSGGGGPGRVTGVARQGSASLTPFEHVGIYEADRAGTKPPADRLPVNLLDPTESDTRPADTLEVGSGAGAVSGAATTVQREVWPWFAWAALGVLLVEWLVYTQRMRV